MTTAAVHPCRPPTPSRIAFLEAKRLQHRGDAVSAGLIAMLFGMAVGAVVFGMGISILYGPVVSHAVALTGIAGIVSCTLAGFVVGAVVHYRRARLHFSRLQGLVPHATDTMPAWTVRIEWSSSFSRGSWRRHGDKEDRTFRSLTAAQRHAARRTGVVSILVPHMRSRGIVVETTRRHDWRDALHALMGKRPHTP